MSGMAPERERSMTRVVLSTSAAARLRAATAFLSRIPSASPVLVIGASRGAADDLVRTVARSAGATFGIYRFSLTELAARTAALAARALRVPATMASVEAMAARAAYDARQAGELAYFAPVAFMPGFPRALSRTLHELRLSGVEAASLATRGPAADDIGRLLARLETQLAAAGADDRASLFKAAAAAWHAAPLIDTRSGTGVTLSWVGVPVVLLDPTLDSRAEQAFAQAVLARAPSAIVTVPEGDERAVAALRDMGADVEPAADDATAGSDLWHLRRYVFTSDRPAPRGRSGDVRLFSAPGEGRETVEIARRILDEAAAGVPFDEMAVFLRAPQQYLGLLEHACARAGVPVYFERGTRRPDPAGRAFVALLSCAVEHLSARRFDEYLSLAQVPRLDRPAAGAEQPTIVRSHDELLPTMHGDDAVETPETAIPDVPPADSDDEAIVAGALRAPWKWEELIVESAVVGGRSRAEGRERWRRRLAGLAAEYEVRRRELQREEPESPRIKRYERDLQNLRHLRSFALPVIDRLAAWPDTATWGEWVEHFSALATAALARPARVLQVLADLRPMAGVGPVSLEEARDVLRDRLLTVDWDPPARRYGCVFVGTPHHARGRSFRVVFVPGLAERIVPQRPREDPLLLDDRRRAIAPDLVRQDDRSRAERLLLRIAIGAASDRLYLSYPRMDVAQTRARVPSFYALDVMRAITGQMPDHRLLANDAADEGGASLAWPAPADPDRAIDDLEHDLAVLRPLLETRDPATVRGRAHYLLALNDALRRSVISRWSRGQRKAWYPADGLVRVAPATAAAIGAHRMHTRAFSLSALQRFASCPYQFLLATIHRLEPWESPEPLVRMDPLTRGSLFHEVQAEFYREMQVAGALPVTHATVEDAVRRVHAVLARVSERYRDELVPAIERVWTDEIADIQRDLGIWVRRLADETTWIPEYFEFAFGLPLAGRDPRSLHDPVLVDGRFKLHGSVDLVERHATNGTLRVTDHKTGKDRSVSGMIVNGGKVLQPVLYSAAIHDGLGATVAEGRLFYCTTAGGFAAHPIVIDDYTRRQGIEVLEIVDRAIEQGFLVAAPDERACDYCDFRPVCGPRERERVKRKPKDRLADLIALRGMR
jgi:ATP-dependent helicase/nuclease subunit B